MRKSEKIATNDYSNRPALAGPPGVCARATKMRNACENNTKYTKKSAFSSIINEY